MIAKWAIVIGLALVALGIVFGLLTAWWVALIEIAGGLLVLLFVIVKVRVESDAFVVGYGPFGWPRNRIPVSDIEAASVIDIRPMRHGGWGYRGSLRLFKKVSVVIRAGPGIHLDLRGGRKFAVTVDDPEAGVAALRAQL